jgi:hypothetical protein
MGIMPASGFSKKKRAIKGEIFRLQAALSGGLEHSEIAEKINGSLKFPQ